MRAGFPQGKPGKQDAKRIATRPAHQLLRCGKRLTKKKLKAEFLLGVPLFFITKNSIFRRAALNHLANIFHDLFKFFLKFMLESFCVDFFK